MNKKFLLLPLAAMTASVYAAEVARPTTKFEADKGQYASLFKNTFANGSTNEIFSTQEDNIYNDYLSQDGQDLSILVIYDYVKKISGGELVYTETFEPGDPATLAELEAELNKITDTQTIKFTPNTLINNTIFLVEKTLDLSYKDLANLQPDDQKQDIKVKDLILNFKAPTVQAIQNLGIKQVNKYIEEHENDTISIETSTAKDQINDKIQAALQGVINQQIIEQYGIKTARFAKKSLLSGIIYKPDEEVELPVTGENEPDQSTDEYKETIAQIQANEEYIKTLFPNITPLQTKIGKAHTSIQTEIDKLIPKNSLKSTLDRTALLEAIEINFTAHKPNTRQGFLNEFRTKAPKLYEAILATVDPTANQETPTPTPLTEIQKRATIIEAIASQQFMNTKIDPDSIYSIVSNEFKFIANMKKVSYANMLNLYNRIKVQKIKNKPIFTSQDPRQWTAQQYQAAIQQIIKKPADALTFGIQPANSKITQETCSNDIQNFNAWQQAKFTIVYLLDQQQ